MISCRDILKMPWKFLNLHLIPLYLTRQSLVRMCRYAMSIYKPHYACFECKKVFKRKLLKDVNRDMNETSPAKCPQCGNLMADMGLDFKAPASKDIKSWQHVKSLYSVGITFHSCGCTGPGYIPADRERLIAFLREKMLAFQQQLAFWRARVAPGDKAARDREISKSWEYLAKIPRVRRSKKEAVSNEEAKKYWLERIYEVEQKLSLVEGQ